MTVHDNNCTSNGNDTTLTITAAAIAAVAAATTFKITLKFLHGLTILFSKSGSK